MKKPAKLAKRKAHSKAKLPRLNDRRVLAAVREMLQAHEFTEGDLADRIDALEGRMAAVEFILGIVADDVLKHIYPKILASEAGNE